MMDEQNRAEVRRCGGRLQYTVTEPDSGMNVGQILKRQMQLTQNQIRRAKFREDGIFCDGEKVRVTHKPAPGSVVSVTVADLGSEEKPSRIETGLRILYEDADLLAVSKRAGMAVHRGRGHYGDTLADRVQQYLGLTQKEIHIVGRLDRDTSGVVLFAKNAVAAQRIAAQPRTDHYKMYLALTAGRMETEAGWKTVSLPMRKQPGALNRMEAFTGSGMPRTGQAAPADTSDSANGWMEAVTRYRVLGSISGSDATLAEQGVSLIEAVPVTGRTHQIRVHMAALGHPLLQDVLYEKSSSEENAEFRGMLLHCAEAHLRHPFTGKELCIRDMNFALCGRMGSDQEPGPRSQ